MINRRDFLKYTAAGTLGLSLRGAGPAPIFEEVPASVSGIAWVHDNAMSDSRFLPETLGPGCAFVDYDNDGWMDIYLVNSGPSDFFQPKKPLRNALYHNNRDGTFTDVTEKAGVTGGTFGTVSYTHLAKVVTYNRFTESREAIAAGILKESGATLVPPFDHPMIIAGQGTAALELLEEVGPLDALITPVGGGGLVSGCATIAKDMQPGIRVFGAEPEGANDTFLSMAAGTRVAVPHPETIADGLRSPKPGALTFPIVQKLVERIILVGDDEMRAAVKFMLLRSKILVEASGASSVAAAMFRKLPPEIRTVGVVISGGNVDFEELVTY